MRGVCVKPLDVAPHDLIHPGFAWLNHSFIAQCQLTSRPFLLACMLHLLVM